MITKSICCNIAASFRNEGANLLYVIEKIGGQIFENCNCLSYKNSSFFSVLATKITLLSLVENLSRIQEW